MAKFDLDLRAVEEHIQDASDGDIESAGPSIVLGLLNGRTPPEEWIEAVDDGNVLVLDIEGDLNDLAAGFARHIKDDGGHLVRFRGFLIVTPEHIEIDTTRLGS